MSFNHFSQAAEAFDKAISQTVRKTAFDVQAAMQSLTPTDTGFLKNSEYVVTAQDSTYSSVPQPTKKDASVLPEIPPPPDDKTAYIAVGANYGVYVNNGTRYQIAQPFVEPAVEQVRPSFESAMSKIESAMKAQGL